MRLFGANAPVINVLYLDKTKERAQRNSVTHCSVVHRPLLAQYIGAKITLFDLFRIVFSLAVT